jgi:hypothetical protein
MPMIHEFQGKVVKRTLIVGDTIAVAFYSRVKGRPGERALLPVAEYRAGLKSHCVPDPDTTCPQHGKPACANGRRCRSRS